MDKNFMKEKPVFPLIASMALPMVISMLVNSLYNIVDSFFVSRISEDAMTALSLVYPIQNLISAIAIGFGVGISAVISLHLGAGEEESANIATTHGAVLSALHGVIVTVVSIPIMPLFLRMFTSNDQVVQMGMQYSTIVFSFSLVLMMSLAFEKFFQSVGMMRETMAGMLCGCAANIVLDPLLIFGIGIFPALGIRGAALATGLGQLVTLIVFLIIYATHNLPIRVSRRYLVPNRKIDHRLYAVGIPAALNLALPSLLVSCLNAMLAAYSQSYVVILGIYYKLQTFLYLPANGIIQGMRPIIGFNYGANEQSRVRKIFSVTLCMCCVIMAVGTAVCLALPARLIGLFTDNPETILAGQSALRIICVGFIVSAISVTSSGALEGIGKGTHSLVISLCRYVVIIIPAAFALSHLFGASGVFHAFWITEAITAMISLAVYRHSLRAR